MSLTFKFPNYPLDYIARVTLGSVAYFAHLQWNWRSADWRISLSNTVTGEYVATSRRMSPGGRIAQLPDGVLTVSGPDPYNQEDLGDLLQLHYFSYEEMMEALAEIDRDPVPSLVV